MGGCDHRDVTAPGDSPRCSLSTARKHQGPAPFGTDPWRCARRGTARKSGASLARGKRQARPHLRYPAVAARPASRSPVAPSVPESLTVWQCQSPPAGEQTWPFSAVFVFDGPSATAAAAAKSWIAEMDSPTAIESAIIRDRRIVPPRGRKDAHPPRFNDGDGGAHPRRRSRRCDRLSASMNAISSSIPRPAAAGVPVRARARSPENAAIPAIRLAIVKRKSKACC